MAVDATARPTIRLACRQTSSLVCSRAPRSLSVHARQKSGRRPACTSSVPRARSDVSVPVRLVELRPRTSAPVTVIGVARHPSAPAGGDARPAAAAGAAARRRRQLELLVRHLVADAAAPRRGLLQP